jgi:hypothetical protein
LFNYLHALFPPYATLLPFGRVNASLSLLGSQSSANERIEIGVFTGFSGTPVELTVYPVCATYWTVSV